MERNVDPAHALAGLRERWGSAAPRRGTEVFGALAAAPLPGERDRPGERQGLQPLPGIGGAGGVPRERPAAAPDAAIPTGFAALDALFVGGGLPRTGTVALVGAGSSGSTTLAMRALAGAQEAGALAAWIDLSRSLDPVEAVARGINLEWLAVLVPDGIGQALAMAGTLLQSRAVGVLVLDLGPGRETVPAPAAARAPARAVEATGRGRSAPQPAEQLARLAAFALRAGALLLVLVPPGIPPSLRSAVDGGAGVRLELRRRGWIRLGREVVGQRTEICVTKDRHGAPDRRTALRILYAEGGPRDRCLARDELLAEEPVARPAGVPFGGLIAAPLVSLPFRETSTPTDAPPPSLLATSRAPARRGEPARTTVGRAADPRRATMG